MVAAYEYPLSFWGEGGRADTFNGGVYVNVTGYWDKKIEALSKYKSQFQRGTGLISETGVTALANLRGVEAGVQYAEVLHVLRIRV